MGGWADEHERMDGRMNEVKILIQKSNYLRNDRLLLNNVQMNY